MYHCNFACKNKDVNLYFMTLKIVCLSLWWFYSYLTLFNDSLSLPCFKLNNEVIVKWIISFIILNAITNKYVNNLHRPYTMIDWLIDWLLYSHFISSCVYSLSVSFRSIAFTGWYVVLHFIRVILFIWIRRILKF